MARSKTHHALVSLLLIVTLAVGGVGYIHDREMAHTYERKRARFDALSEALGNVNVAYWEWNLETDEIQWSTRLWGIYGWPEESLATYDRWLQIVHPQDRSRVDAICRRAVETGESYVMTYRVIGADGELRIIMESASIAATGNVMVGVCVANQIGDALAADRAAASVSGDSVSIFP